MSRALEKKRLARIVIKNPAGRDIVTISISGGISIFRENDSDYNDAVKRADDALYNSKKLGKNRVSILL
jgi:GGDEF domain-containing protein